MPARLAENRILSALSGSDEALIEPHLTPLDLERHHRLSVPGEPIAHGYFLAGGLASMVAGVRHEPPVELGIIGREGFVGLPIVFGAGSTPIEFFMQVPGGALRIEADRLADLLEESATLRTDLLRYSHVFSVQIASTVLANARATLAERLARWLLMARDRHGDGSLPLTHELLAVMLGVRRPGVTVALSEFSRRGLIVRYRGRIEVIDTAGLTELANGYYGMAEQEYDRLFGRDGGRFGSVPSSKLHTRNDTIR
jgi:CRP-like cAMP-binding protein